MAGKPQQYKTNALVCFEKYTNFQLINESELDTVVNYICGHLNTNYTFSSTKSKIVLRYRKRRGLDPVVKLGECICEEKVVDFLKNPDKKCNCGRGCA